MKGFPSIENDILLPKRNSLAQAKFKTLYDVHYPLIIPSWGMGCEFMNWYSFCGMWIEETSTDFRSSDTQR